MLYHKKKQILILFRLYFFLFLIRLLFCEGLSNRNLLKLLNTKSNYFSNNFLKEKKTNILVKNYNIIQNSFKNNSSENIFQNKTKKTIQTNYIKKKKRPNPKIKIYQLNRLKQKKNLSFKFNNWKIELLLDIKKPIIIINILKTFRIKKIMGLICGQFKSIFSITNPLFQFSKLHNKKLKISFEIPKKSDEIILANYLTFVQNLNQFFIRVSKTKHLKARLLQATEEIKDPNSQNQNEIESKENKNDTQNGNDKNTKDNQNPSTDEKKEETNNLNTKTDEASDHTSNDDEHYITLKIHKMNFLVAVCCIMGIIILIMIFVCCCCFCCKKNESTNQNRSMSMNSINQTEEQKYRVPQPRAKAFSQNSNYVPNSVNRISNHRIEYTAQNKRKIQSEMVNHLNDSSLSSSFDRNSDDMENRPADGTRKSKKKRRNKNVINIKHKGVLKNVNQKNPKIKNSNGLGAKKKKKYLDYNYYNDFLK